MWCSHFPTTEAPFVLHSFEIAYQKCVLKCVYLFVLRYTEVKANDGEKHPCFDIVQEVGIL